VRSSRISASASSIGDVCVWMIRSEDLGIPHGFDGGVWLHHPLGKDVVMRLFWAGLIFGAYVLGRPASRGTPITGMDLAMPDGPARRRVRSGLGTCSVREVNSVIAPLRHLSWLPIAERFRRCPLPGATGASS
jgi:hypothetical protein